jgi:hypothetical protein
MCHTKSCRNNGLTDCDFCNYRFCGLCLSPCRGCDKVLCQVCLRNHNCVPVSVPDRTITGLAWSRFAALMVLCCVSVVWGQTLPDAPGHSKFQTIQFWAVTGSNAFAISLDAYTTAQQGSNSRCKSESGSTWIYTKHPTPGRIVWTMGGEFALDVAAAKFLPKLPLPKRLRFIRRLNYAPSGWSIEQHLKAGIGNLRGC